MMYIPYKEEQGMDHLLELKEKWGIKYPNAVATWESNWDNLSTFFIFPDYIRKIMYTTNCIESLTTSLEK